MRIAIDQKTSFVATNATNMPRPKQNEAPPVDCLAHIAKETCISREDAAPCRRGGRGALNDLRALQRRSAFEQLLHSHAAVQRHTANMGR